PGIRSSGSCAIANDFDRDGDLDLFVGGRFQPLRYPESPESFLLQNNGRGNFRDITPTDMKRTGMVTSALWTDFDNDNWTDLIIAGEWMPITFFKNQNGSLKKFEPQTPAKETTVGWWNSLAAGDFDNDGDTDYIAGNLGLNSLYKASNEEPVCIYAKDFDGNGSLDPVLCRYVQGKEFITHPRETLTEQIVGLRRVLTRYSTYGKSTFAEIFPEEKLQGALILRSTRFASSFIENKGGGTFNFKTLPVAAQLSPMFGVVVTDFDSDGNLDVLSVGNSYSTEPLTGFYDAGIGTCLRGDGRGNFEPVHVNKSGFFVDRDAKGLIEMRLGGDKVAWVATSNRDSLKVFESDGQSAVIVRLLPDDAFAEVTLASGKKRKQEFHYGSSYLSQSSRILKLPPGVRDVFITNTKGVKRRSFPF
ncbi:MAG TPA: VCBS repeat-containing protein, partial [Chryseosolibacter sp.]|nr:VCBS repeat-containing protein [Chryseosolibacter sp.]